MNEKTRIFGRHAVEALLKKRPKQIEQLSILKERHDQPIQQLIALAEENDVKLVYVTRNVLDGLVHQAVHQGIVADCHPPTSYSESHLEQMLCDLSHPAFLLILDGVTDPHNVGACLRSSDAAGVDGVIVPKDKSVGLTSTVCKVACGAAETVPFFQVTNLARTMRFLKEQGIWLHGASHDADKTLYQADFKGSIALVLGAEGTGLRRLTREHCDVLLRIPMQGAVSSLNVSVAAGILLFEAVRQRAS